MSIKYIFSDVDLTLVGKDRTLKKETIDTITKVREKGVKFIIASGRVPVALKDYFEALSINDKDDEYAICGNGSIVTNTKLEFIIDNPLNKKDIIEALNYLNNIEVDHYSLVSSEQYYNTSLPWEMNKPGSSKVGTLVSKKELFDLVGKLKFYKFYITDSDVNKLEKIAKAIEKVTNGALTYTYSGTYNLEIINRDCSKGNALKKFCELKHIDLSETLAIGDNLNDESMMDVAGSKACPSNAVKAIQNKCDYISPIDCENDAMSEILTKLVLNK